MDGLQLFSRFGFLSPAYDTNFPSQTIDIFGEWKSLPMSNVHRLPGEYSTQLMFTEESFYVDGGQYAGN